MFGLSKWFVIFLFLSLAVWYQTGNKLVALQIMLGFAVVKIIWVVMTKK